MRSLLLSILLSFLVLLSLNRCANVGSPTGGPRDTIPPELVSSYPALNELNVNTKTITLTFSEDIKQKNLQQELLISPRTDIRYKTKISRNELSLIFEEPLEDSTTYTFNFRQGIGDLNEGNAVENLYLAFSTGSYIDSLAIEGNVKDLFTGQPIKEATLALFKVTDSVNVQKQKPDYFSLSDESGDFSLKNLKGGNYILYAYTDKNNNLTLQTKNEPYGYIADTLQLDSINLNDLAISLFRLNADSLKQNSARTTGNYFEVGYNKGIQNLEFKPKNIELPDYQFIEEGKKLRFYPKALEQDSLELVITAYDTLGLSSTDTVMLKFKESERKSPEFTASYQPDGGKNLPIEATVKILFSKPVLSLNQDSIFFKYDSLTTQPLDTNAIDWNRSRTELTLTTRLVPPAPVKDTTSQQAKETASDARAMVATSKESSSQKVELVIAKQAVISIESDTLQAKVNQYTIKKADAYGIIKGSVKPTAKPFILQLVDNSNQKVIRETNGSPSSYEYTWLPPGEYHIRIIHDQNSNGIWDGGNIYSLSPPEAVNRYSEAITVKENWVIEQPLIDVEKPVDGVETVGEKEEPTVELE